MFPSKPNIWHCCSASWRLSQWVQRMSQETGASVPNTTPTWHFAPHDHMYEIHLHHPLSIQILKIKMSSTKCTVSDTTHATPFYHSKGEVSSLGFFAIRIWTENHLVLHVFERHVHKTVSCLQMLNTIMRNQRTRYSRGPSISFYIRSDLWYKNLVVVLETDVLSCFPYKHGFPATNDHDYI